MAMPRSRGAIIGVLLVILGLWGALIPFVGPYFDFSVGNNKTWDWTNARLWLSVLPGAATVLGGLILLRSRNRGTASLGAWLALAGGLWFLVGQTTSLLWNHGTNQAGRPFGSDSGRRVLEELGYFYALGGIIVGLAAFALGRLAVRSVRDVEYAEQVAAAPVVAPVAREPVRRPIAEPVADAPTRVVESVARTSEGVPAARAVVDTPVTAEPDPAAVDSGDGVVDGRRRGGLLSRLRR